MWQWIDTAVPFAVAFALLLVLFRQVQRRRSGLPSGFGTWLRPPSEARSGESPATSENVWRISPANPPEVVPFKRRFKAMVWLIIVPLFLVTFGMEAYAYTQSGDHAWAGMMLFFATLAGVPTAATLAAVNACLAELAQRHLIRWNALGAGVIGCVSCVFLQVFGAFLGPAAVLLLILPHTMTWVVVPPLVSGMLAVLVELIVRTPPAVMRARSRAEARQPTQQRRALK